MKLPLLEHQVRAVDAAWGKPYFAYLMEQGTGKTFCALAEAEKLFQLKRITLAVIIAPNGVQRNWIEREAPKLLSIPFVTLTWTPNHTQRWLAQATDFAKNPAHSSKLRLCAFNVEAFDSREGKAQRFLRGLLRVHPQAYIALDESSTIKNYGAATSRVLIKECDKPSVYRRILTGTDITQSPFNAFSQYKFLSRFGNLLGFEDFTPFKAYYAEWGIKQVPDRSKPGEMRPIQELKRYRNLKTLKERIDAHAFRVLKKDCLNLPEKVYTERTVEPTPQQRALYELAKKELVIQLQSGKMTLAHAFTRLTRLAQITGGFLREDESEAATPIPGPNPKIKSLLGYIAEAPEAAKLIIWARYKPELYAIEAALRHEFGQSSLVTYHGDVDEDLRHLNIDKFQNDSACRFFVANQATGKWGLTLTAASRMVYFSNSFSAEARWQSEDRFHRIGQTAESCELVDLIIPGTTDRKILSTLSVHKDLADAFKGEPAAMARWLTNDEED